MRLYKLILAVFMGLFAAAAAVADAQNRTALIFGNAAYQNARLQLKNPVRDAQDMATALQSVGFAVNLRLNQDKRGMEQAIRQFGDQLRSKGGVGLFYYAGHGAQVNGKNYLVPVDAKIKAEDEAAYESVVAQLLLDKMRSAQNDLNIIILDACRDNPYPTTTRSAAQSGLASMEPPSGSIMAFSTAPNDVALDGEGNNGLYTQELLKYIGQPDLKIEDVFKRVRKSVRLKSQQLYGNSRRAQIPWEHSSIEGDFYFSLANSAAPSSLSNNPVSAPKPNQPGTNKEKNNVNQQTRNTSASAVIEFGASAQTIDYDSIDIP